MKITKQFKRKPLASWVAASLVSATMASGVAFAAPLAGTEIKNLATVTYEDDLGNKYTAQSNEAVITVAEQFRATLEQDGSLSGAPGQTVYFPHVLKNTGNTPDTYTLAATNGATIYNDKNGNGQPDAGEEALTTIDLAAGEIANLIVAYTIPVSAVDGSAETVTLTATTDGAGGTIEDIGTNSDADTLDNEATNDNTVNVTSGPVLVMTKQAVVDEANNRITYTLTVKNTGGSDATAVNIIDAIPMVDGVMLDSLTIDSVNGLLDANSDTILPVGALAPADLVDIDETVMGVDINGDGDALDTAVASLKMVDAVLPQNTTVSIVFSGDYDPTWAAGTAVENTFIGFPTDPTDPTNPTGPVVPSNKTTTTIPTTYGAGVDDDGLGTPTPGVNDGADDDGTANDGVQTVDTAPAAATVLFTHVVTNNGNGEDTFNLSVDNNTAEGFPAGTIFTFWSADGSVPLTDSDGDGRPDTGGIDQGGTATIVVKAILPAAATGTGPFNATLTATSSGDDTQSDTATLQLGAIIAPQVDLAAVGAAQANTGFNDAGVADAHDEGPVVLIEPAVGATTSIALQFANESGSSDSYVLNYDNLPEGWSVVFKDASGSVITSTPLIPAGSVFDYTAELTVSAIPAEALADAVGSGADGYDANDNDDADATTGIGAVLTGGDGDEDYVVTFNVTSSSNAASTDELLVAVDVADIDPAAALKVTPDGQNQVQPGGTVEYPHNVTNNGNGSESVELVSSNTGTGWNSSILVERPDGTLVDISTLVAGDLIVVYDKDGNPVNVAVTDTDGDGNVEIPLEPGEIVKIINKVFAPAGGAEGSVNQTTITATDADGTVRSTATDSSTIVTGQVRLDKTVALQTDCTDPTTIGTFAAIQSAKVEPGECIVWKIDAINEGTLDVMNVVVKDTVPAFTTMLTDSMQLCNGVGCTPATVTETIGDDAGELDNGTVVFYVGDRTGVDADVGGTLKGGESSTVQFTVKVDE